MKIKLIFSIENKQIDKKKQNKKWLGTVNKWDFSYLWKSGSALGSELINILPLPQHTKNERSQVHINKYEVLTNMYLTTILEYTK